MGGIGFEGSWKGRDNEEKWRAKKVDDMREGRNKVSCSS